MKLVFAKNRPSLVVGNRAGLATLIARVIASVVIGVLCAFGFVFALSRAYQTTAVWFIAVLVSIAVAYISLSRVILPTLQRLSWIVRLGLVALAVIIAMLVPMPTHLAATPTIDWHWADTSNDRAGVINGQTWDRSEQSVIELHSSLDPGRTDYGHHRIVADVTQLLEGKDGRFRLSFTQPSWAVLDPATGNVTAQADGVQIAVSVTEDGKTKPLQTLDLVPSQPDYLNWHDVTLHLPAASRMLIIEVLPYTTMNNDRVWMTVGQLDAPSRDSIVAALRFGAGYLLLLAITAVTALFISTASQPIRIATIDLMAKYGWQIYGATALYIGYLLVWRRGLYLDDNSLKSIAVDLLTGERLPFFDPSRNPNFPARILTWILLPQLAAMVPDHEFLLRVFLAALVGLNGLLLGYLVTCILDSRLAGIVAGLTFLFPIYTDVTLWLAAIAYLIATALTLVLLICAWATFTQPQYYKRYALIGATSFGISLLFGENCIAAIGLIPILWFISNIKSSRPLAHNIRLAALFTVLPSIVLAVIYKALYTTSLVVTGRKGLDISILSIIDRFSSFLSSFYLWTIEPSWGLKLYRQAFSIGFLKLTGSVWTMLLSAFALGIAVIFAISLAKLPNDRHHPNRIGWIVLLTGVIWFITALMLPYTLAHDSGFERRYLYFPGAGGSVAFASVVWLISKQRVFARDLRLLMTVVIAIVSLMAVTMLGFAETYAARDRLNTSELQALKQAVPPELVPPGTVFVPYKNDETLFGKDDLISLHVFGAFETPWSANIAIWKTYMRYDVGAIAVNRWAATNFTYSETSSGSIRLKIQDKDVPLDRTVLFQYRQGRVAVIKSLSLVFPDGGTIDINFPLAQTVTERGTTGIDNVVIPVETP